MLHVSLLLPCCTSAYYFHLSFNSKLPFQPTILTHQSRQSFNKATTFLTSDLHSFSATFIQIIISLLFFSPPASFSSDAFLPQPLQLYYLHPPVSFFQVLARCLPSYPQHFRCMSQVRLSFPYKRTPSSLYSLCSYSQFLPPFLTLFPHLLQMHISSHPSKSHSKILEYFHVIHSLPIHLPLSSTTFSTHHSPPHPTSLVTPPDLLLTVQNPPHTATHHTMFCLLQFLTFPPSKSFNITITYILKRTGDKGQPCLSLASTSNHLEHSPLTNNSPQLLHTITDIEVIRGILQLFDHKHAVLNLQPISTYQLLHIQHHHKCSGKSLLGPII